jgi:hypothetical protein
MHWNNLIQKVLLYGVEGIWSQTGLGWGLLQTAELQNSYLIPFSHGCIRLILLTGGHGFCGIVPTGRLTA